MTLLPLAILAATLAAAGAAVAGNLSGSYASLEWMDVRRVLMRVPKGVELPPAEEEVMLEELEQWKWRVEMAAAGGAVLVTFSQCPHGLGLLPVAMEWKGGGRWRSWPGTFQYGRGILAGLTKDNTAEGKWEVISDSRACEGTRGLRAVGKEQVGRDLGACQRECQRRAGCKAVDYYRTTRWCAFWDQACTDPKSSHDQASSYRLVPQSEIKREGVLHVASMSFLAAKQWCQEQEECKGFGHEGTWSDQDREGGVPREVFFSNRGEVFSRDKSEAKWHSYVRRDNPRANCNPEGEQFECPNNPYACLGLSMDADENAVKQAYRGLSKQMHPDKLKVRSKENIKQAEAAFREVSESNEVLRDPRKRREVDFRLQQERHEWQRNRESVQDLYIKEPQISSLEPESYPVLIPKGQEWLVHFFLPTNPECKQMKVAMGRAVSELGTGEEERYEPNDLHYYKARFDAGDVFRGRMRMKSLALKNDKAGAQEGDSHIALVVEEGGTGQLFMEEEQVAVTIQVTQPAEKGERVQASINSDGRSLRGTFDKNREWFRGTVLVSAREVASFILQLETWEPLEPLPGSKRQLPRLFGAVNCGRFGDFCKRKGADPAKEKDFPQVRVLFPGETRFEVYTGRALGKELTAFAREATRPTGPVEELDLDAVGGLQAAASQPWLLLLRRTPSGGDCPLSKTALPMLRRTVPRLAKSRLRAGWVNCSSQGPICDLLGGTSSCWGRMVLTRLGGGSVQGIHAEETCAGCSRCDHDTNHSQIFCQECIFNQASGASRNAPAAMPLPSGESLWDGEATTQGLLAALEAAARTAELLEAQALASAPLPASPPAGKAEL